MRVRCGSQPLPRGLSLANPKLINAHERPMRPPLRRPVAIYVLE